jgi:hypothetical protein
MRKLILGILFFGVLVSCSNKMDYPDAPDDLVPEEQMIEYLHDLTILEAGIQNRYQSVNRYYKTMIRSGENYLKSKGMTVDRFERSFDYYVTQPEVFQRITTAAMDKMTIELNEKEAKGK